jgi:hypothetical protein
MKKKYNTFIEPVSFILASAFIVVVVIAPVMILYLLIAEGEIADLSEGEYLRGYFLALIFLLCDMVAFLNVAPRGWATITLYDDRVTWRAPFRKSVTLKFDEIKYAGVDFSNAQASAIGLSGEAEALYLSAYIYLSVLPYMPRRGKEFKKVYNEDGIIMFKYSEKLCPALVEKIPDDVGRSLKDFDKRIKKSNKKK